jgi:uncharacterized protein (DUF1778 family)
METTKISSMKKTKYKSYLIKLEQAKYDAIKESATAKGMTIKSFILSHFIKP